MDDQFKRPETTGESFETPPAPVEPTVAPVEPTTPVIVPPVAPTPQPMQHAGAKGKNIIIAVLTVLLFLALGAIAYLVMNESKQPAAKSADTTQKEQEVEKEEAKPTRFTSALWPDLAFDVPVGWTATEPADYDPSNPDGAKFADGKISVKSDDTTLTFSLSTVRVMGIVGPAPCYTKENLHHITGDLYRFTEKGKLIIEPGYTASSSKWKELTTGEMAAYEPGNNFCQSGWPIVGTYASTIKQSESPDYPYGWANNTYVMVHARAEATGDLSDTQLSHIDAIIKSLSKSTEIIDL